MTMTDSEIAVRDVSVEDAMSMAIQCQRTGHLADAQLIYGKILAVAPEHAPALHFSGVLAHQQGRTDEAVALIEKSLALEPNQPDAYSNIGIVCKARGDVDKAIAAYRQAIALH